jgi:hypothetical protein
MRLRADRVYISDAVSRAVSAASGYGAWSDPVRAVLDTRR